MTGKPEVISVVRMDLAKLNQNLTV